MVTVRNLLQDLRYGIRTSLRNPGFTLVAVVTLAIGVATSTTVFNWLDMMLLRPIPGASGRGELLSFEEVGPDGNPLGTSWSDFRDYRDRLTLVSGLAAAVPCPVGMGSSEHADRVWGELVSANYFEVLGVRPALGRFFSREESADTPGAFPVVVLGHELWRRRFNADPRIIGASVTVNGEPLTVIGVAPADFRGSMAGMLLEMWVPVPMAGRIRALPDSFLTDRVTHMFTVFARLRPGVTMNRARAECSSVAHRIAEMEPRTNMGIGATLLRIRDAHFGAQVTVGGPLRILMASCAVLFLIVCANVSNLLLARSIARRKEFSIHMAMGSGRGRLLSRLLAESLVLAVLGVLTGVPLALWMTQSLQLFMPRGAYVSLALDMPLNADLLAFSALLCVAACVVSGLAPAVQASRTSVIEALKEGGRSGRAGARPGRLRGMLVMSEVALALVAVIGAGLFARSFQMARRISPGFDPRNILLAHVDLSGAGYTPADRHSFCDHLHRRLVSQPGVVSVSWADVIPLWFTGNPAADVQVEGYVPAPTESMQLHRNVVAPGWLSMVRIPLLEGREFTDRDTETSQRVALVNRTFAERYFGGGPSLGRRLRAFGAWYTIVGVTANIKCERPTEPALPYFYVPFRQAFQGTMPILYVRTAGEPERAAATIRREISAIDPAVRIFDSMPMTEAITAGLFGQKIAAVMLTLVGLAALVLATVGLYGVMAYSVAQRTQEIGIRMALGARPADVLSQVVREGMRITLVGIAGGVVAALALMRLASSLLVQVSATDPLIFAGGSLFLAAVALAASYLPARRATRVDPCDALRAE